jgi:hypothetical protein
MAKRKQEPSLVIPDADLELEIARRRAQHHVRDAARVLVDALPYAPDLATRQLYTDVTGDLSTIERKLDGLARKL